MASCSYNAQGFYYCTNLKQNSITNKEILVDTETPFNPPTTTPSLYYPTTTPEIYPEFNYQKNISYLS